MTKGYARDAVETDVKFIADEMREADVAEVKASSGNNPEGALRDGLATRSIGGRVKTICLSNGYPVGMFGIVPTNTPWVGVVWMLASNRILPLNRQFLKESRQGIDELCQGYRLVFNLTDARNHVHHRWIKWSGFTFIKRHAEWGVERSPFYEFVRITEKHDV